MGSETKCDCAASRVLHERGCASLATPTPTADREAYASVRAEAFIAPPGTEFVRRTSTGGAQVIKTDDLRAALRARPLPAEPE